MRNSLGFLLITLWGLSAQAADGSNSLLLVASPRMGAMYQQTVLVATPVGNNRHAGFIINRPTTRSLASLFPDHPPSKKVKAPVYFGGPAMMGALFAVIRTKGTRDDPRGMRLLADTLVFGEAEAIDQIIEKTPNDARYYVGFVAWQPGELDSEIAHGYWHVLQPDSELLFREDTGTMWQELLHRARNTLQARAAVGP
jgi:putative AlgH/UPF0301 family transcriptional regulator